LQNDLSKIFLEKCEIYLICPHRALKEPGYVLIALSGTE
jgi:hypothetical protein